MKLLSKLSLALILVSPVVMADTITMTWSKYVDTSVSPYNEANYQMVGFCTVITAAGTQSDWVERIRVDASQTSGTFEVAIEPKGRINCNLRAYRKTTKEYSDPTGIVSYVKALPPSIPTGNVILIVVP